MIKERHPMVAELFVGSLEGVPDTPHLREAAKAARSIRGVIGFEPPSWPDFEAGVRPEDRDPEDCEPGGIRSGWQHEAASRVEQQFREGLFEHKPVSRKALVRSQGGPGAGLTFTTCPTNFLTTFTPQFFRVLLLWRLGLPLPPTAPFCRCGHPLNSCGHHRAALRAGGGLGT